MLKKETYYFPHDYTPTDDPKIMGMVSQYGAAGYGLYWRIVEMLHVDPNHQLPTKQYLMLAIAKQMNSTPDFLLQFINDCVNIFELFEQDHDMIICKRVNRNIEDRERKTNIAKANGSKGGEARAKQIVATAKQNVAIKGNKRKVKEIKEKEEIETIVSNEIEEDEGFIAFQNFILAETPRVSKMEEPFTKAEFYRLINDYTQPQIEQLLHDMHNYKNLFKTSVNANSTLRKWANRNGIVKLPNSQPPQYPHL